MPSPNESGYTVFIAGDTIDLCVPSELAITRDGWADWFNDPNATRFIAHRDFPNTQDDQRRYLMELRSSNRLACLIVPKSVKRAVGIVSLSRIDHSHKLASISLVSGAYTEDHRLNNLEAMARIMIHGFEHLALNNIYGAQAFPELKGWNKRLELLGFRTEGINRDAFVKGRKYFNASFISCLYDDYCKITELRKGKFWPGGAVMEKLLSQLPEVSFSERLHEFFQTEGEKYYENLTMTI